MAVFFTFVGVVIIFGTFVQLSADLDFDVVNRKTSGMLEHWLIFI